MLFSIIVPIYNVEKYIPRCIDSILKQTVGDFELIMVDDGSTDSSKLLLDNYAKIDTRIRVLSKDNGGLSDARNFGLNIAKGEFVLFVDGDDYIEPNLLERTLQVINNDEIDVCIFGYFVDIVDGSESLKEQFSVTFFNTENDFSNIKPDPRINNLLGYAWNKIYKRSIIDNTRFVKGLSLIEDIEFNNRILTKNIHIRFLPDVLYHYIQRNRKSLGRTLCENWLDLKMSSLMMRLNIYKYHEVNISELKIQDFIKNIIVDYLIKQSQCNSFADIIFGCEHMKQSLKNFVSQYFNQVNKKEYKILKGITLNKTFLTLLLLILKITR